jgi:hypothetical protein
MSRTPRPVVLRGNCVRPEQEIRPSRGALEMLRGSRLNSNRIGTEELIAIPATDVNRISCLFNQWKPGFAARVSRGLCPLILAQRMIVNHPHVDTIGGASIRPSDLNFDMTWGKRAWQLEGRDLFLLSEAQMNRVSSRQAPIGWRIRDFLVRHFIEIHSNFIVSGWEFPKEELAATIRWQTIRSFLPDNGEGRLYRIRTRTHRAGRFGGYPNIDLIRKFPSVVLQVGYQPETMPCGMRPQATFRRLYILDHPWCNPDLSKAPGCPEVIRRCDLAEENNAGMIDICAGGLMRHAGR